MEDNQIIVQALREKNIPLQRVSTLEDIDTLDDENKKSITNNSYLLLAYNNGSTKANYKGKVSSIVNEFVDPERLNNIEAELNFLRDQLGSVIPTKPEVETSIKQKTYFFLVNESNKADLVNSLKNLNGNDLTSLDSNDSKAIKGVTSGCPMTKGQMYWALTLIKDRWSFGDIDKINEPLYMILPSKYLNYEGNNIKINGYYLKSNTLILSVDNKASETFNIKTPTETKKIYNYENRTETINSIENVSYRCLLVTNTIESGLGLIYN